MIGKYDILVENNKVSFSFTIKRKITIINGESATGKSYFFKLLLGDKSVIKKCNGKDDCIMAITDKRSFENALKDEGMILVVDESLSIFENISDYTGSINKSNNYFIFITRSYLKGIPYSIKEIYTFDTKVVGKKNITTLKPSYDSNSIKVKSFKGVVITEDTKSGNDFYKRFLPNCSVYPENGINGGLENVKKVYTDLSDKGMLDEKYVFIIIDSSAFGSEIGELEKAVKVSVNESKGIVLMTPESFEYLICYAKLKGTKDELKVLETYNYCDTKDFISWERYFTDLVSNVLDTYKNSKASYSKKKLCKEVIDMGSDIIKVLKEVG